MKTFPMNLNSDRLYEGNIRRGGGKNPSITEADTRSHCYTITNKTQKVQLVKETRGKVEPLLKPIWR